MSNGLTLHKAVEFGRVTDAILSIMGGAEVEPNDDGTSPLHLAAKCGGDDWYVLTWVLLAQGADVNKRDMNGNTALHFAADRGDIRTATLLLDHGAHHSATTRDGCTPLHLAAGGNHKTMVQLLHARGAKLNSKTKAGDTPLDWARQEGKSGMMRFIKALGGE